MAYRGTGGPQQTVNRGRVLQTDSDSLLLFSQEGGFYGGAGAGAGAGADAGAGAPPPASTQLFQHSSQLTRSSGGGIQAVQRPTAAAPRRRQSAAQVAAATAAAANTAAAAAEHALSSRVDFVAPEVCEGVASRKPQAPPAPTFSSLVTLSGYTSAMKNPTMLGGALKLPLPLRYTSVASLLANTNDRVQSEAQLVAELVSLIANNASILTGESLRGQFDPFPSAPPSSSSSSLFAHIHVPALFRAALYAARHFENSELLTGIAHGSPASMAVISGIYTALTKTTVPAALIKCVGAYFCPLLLSPSLSLCPYPPPLSSGRTTLHSAPS